MVLPQFVGWMQEGPKFTFVILWEKQFCAQIFFVFLCFLNACSGHKNVNNLSWDLYYESNVSFYIFFQYLQQTWFHPKCHLRPSCIHMTNCLRPIRALTLPKLCVICSRIIIYGQTLSVATQAIAGKYLALCLKRSVNYKRVNGVVKVPSVIFFSDNLQSYNHL